MANLTAESIRLTKEIDHSTVGVYAMAAVKIWKGAIVARNSSGYATNAGDTASTKVLGIAEETKDNSGGAAGDLTIKVRWNHQVNLAGDGNVTIADLGDNATVLDNQTVSDAGTTTNDIVVGEVLAVADTTNGDPSGSVWVRIRNNG